jgi:hypothetical protein
MNDEDRDIDALLRAGVERQLTSFDWERLGRGIEQRVTRAGARSHSWARHGRWVAVAAGIALTVGVLASVIIRGARHGPVAGEAIVAMIENIAPAGSAQVSFSPAETPARGEVTILAQNKPQQQKSRAQASWCIIAMQEPSTGEPRDDRDSADVLCLF